MSTNLGESRGFLDAIDLPVRVIRTRFRQLYGVALAVTLAATLPGALLQFYSNDPGNPTGFPSAENLFAVLLLLGLSVLLTVVSQLTIYEAVRRALDGEPIPLGACVAKGIKPLSVVVVLGSYLALFVSLLCFCVPGVIVGLGLIFVMASLVDGGHSGLAAIPRSWELVYYRWSEIGGGPMWIRAAGVALVYYLIQLALSSITTAPAFVIGFFLMMREAASGSSVSYEELTARMSWLQAFVTLLGALATSLATLYAASAFTLLFRQAREEREAPGVGRALDVRLAETEPGPS